VRDGHTGFLVPGRKPGPFADRLLYLLTHPQEARAMGEAGVVQALRFSWDATTEDILSVYREVLRSSDRWSGARAAGA